MRDAVRLLLVADTHLGFDLPLRPRVERRRRGPDFFARFEQALEPALRGEVDLVVHGGDLLFRSKVRPSLVLEALEPLFRVADAGVPVFVVPGNHERSAIPYGLLARRERIHVFDRPRTFGLELAGRAVSLSGFPFVRERARERFGSLVAQTGWQQSAAQIRLLCLHQIVEGARVGPTGFTFCRGDDVIRARKVPAGFAAVLCGHVHRAQVLRADLAGRALGASVYYPGSVERTSFAEQDETKGCYLLELRSGGVPGGQVVGEEFRRLDARPMTTVEIDATGRARAELESAIRAALTGLPSDAVVRLRVGGELGDEASAALRAARVRRLTPPTMNVEVALYRGADR